jgi:hypothetical protein
MAFSSENATKQTLSRPSDMHSVRRDSFLRKLRKHLTSLFVNFIFNAEAFEYADSVIKEDARERHVLPPGA